MKIMIKYNRSDLTSIFRASNRVLLRCGLQAEKIPNESAAEYVAAIRVAITLKKYRIEYNKRYRDWKAKNIGHLKSYILSGDLLNNLSRTKLGNGIYLGGVKAGIFDRGGKSWFTDIDKGKRYGEPKEIAMYGRAVEAIHPLFVPELAKYRRRWLIKIKNSERYIKEAWRKRGTS